MIQVDNGSHLHLRKWQCCRVVFTGGAEVLKSSRVFDAFGVQRVVLDLAVVVRACQSCAVKDVFAKLWVACLSSVVVCCLHG